MNYFRKSVEKLKQDGLSKVFYDILKYLLIALLALTGGALIPKDTSFGSLLFRPITLSLLAILLIGMTLIIVVVIIVSLILKKKYEKFKEDNFTDDLTGLKNHKAFKEALENKIEVLKTSDKTFSLILIDIDDFKKLNSDYSTNFADEVLGKLGELLANDKRITDETFRQFLRGDEFVIIASETSLNDAIKAAERKRQLIEKTTFIVNDVKCKLTVSCGVTEVKRSTDDLKTITTRVNEALLEAKGVAGKNNTKPVI